MSLKPLHIDGHIIVAVKPAGLLAVPGRGADKQDCLSARLAIEFGDIHIVHRLDQATSGLMVFARTLTALRELHAQFREGVVAKSYQAIVVGKPAQTSFCIDLPLGADWPNRPKQKVSHERGKPSATEVEVMRYDETSNTSRVRLVPLTGRTHQLRVHMMASGHAIVGDALYGETNDSQAMPTMASRLMLHASALSFLQPDTRERLVFESAPEF